MSRFVKALPRKATEATNGDMDGYFDRIVKYIPTEIVGLYLTVLGLLSKISDDQKVIATWHFCILLACWVLVFAYLYWRIPKNQPFGWQIAIAMGAFPVWVYAIGGGAFGEKGQWFCYHNPVAASIFLAFYTVAVGVYQPYLPEQPVPPPHS